MLGTRLAGTVTFAYPTVLTGPVESNCKMLDPKFVFEIVELLAMVQEVGPQVVVNATVTIELPELA